MFNLILEVVVTYLEVATKLAGSLRSAVWIRPPTKRGIVTIFVSDKDPMGPARRRSPAVEFSCPGDPAVTPWVPGGEVGLSPGTGDWYRHHRTPLRPLYMAAASGSWSAVSAVCDAVGVRERADQINAAVGAEAVVVDFSIPDGAPQTELRPGFRLNPRVVAPDISPCWYAWADARLEDGPDLQERVVAIIAITREHRAALESGERRGACMPPRPTALISATEYAREQAREQERLRREWEALPEAGETHGGGFYDD